LYQYILWYNTLARQSPPDQHVGRSPCQGVILEDVLIQLFPPDDERLSLETWRGRKINTLKKVKKCVKLVVNPELPQDARSTKYTLLSVVQCDGLSFIDFTQVFIRGSEKSECHGRSEVFCIELYFRI
jgi:hypothetical protein